MQVKLEPNAELTHEWLSKRVKELEEKLARLESNKYYDLLSITYSTYKLNLRLLEKFKYTNRGFLH